MSFEDGKVVLVYHKKSGKIISHDVSPLGEVIIPKEYQKKEDEYLVGCFAQKRIDWETGYVILD